MLRKLFVVGLLAALVVGSVAAPALAGGKKTVLIYGKTFGFRHGGAIDKGSPILKQVAEGLGYQAVISEDPAVFDADAVKKWDVIVFNNCTGGLNPKEPERREALMARIKDGAGFMGFHAATDCNTQWPEYGKMINGYFWGHPWNQKVESKVEDPDHPLMKAFKGGPFVIKDEIYQFRDYDRSAVRVLMSIDTRSVPVSRGRRKDRDYAICWIRPWDKGRVYYNAHGHAENVFQDKIFQEHLKPAMQLAAGDIEVATTPSKAIDTAALAAG
ncbi:ThuA domain-containing protein, partial [bacterium]|nr:ThuA domain-containing protein [bacterium]